MSNDFLPGNRVRLLECGTEYFPALTRALDGARKEVFLESYIFEDDATGHRIADALANAARRGVGVHVMVDGFGARNFFDALGRELLSSGVRVLIYRQEINGLLLRRHRLRRLHRKLVVIDGRLGFVGGINIIDDSNTPHQVPPRFDYAVEVEGPVVAQMHAQVRMLWQLVNLAAFRRRGHAVGQGMLPEPCTGGTVEAALVIRDNLLHRRDIENAYLDAILSARREIVIASAYFLPGRRFRRALDDAAARGVNVIVLLQGRVEYRLLHHATQSLYARLLGRGVRIFEYRRSFLHAKVGVIDGMWATVGSSNIDPFSLLLAREANLVVRDAGFATQLHGSLTRAMKDGAVEIRAADISRRGFVERLVNRLAYSLVRMAIALTRYGGVDYRE